MTEDLRSFGEQMPLVTDRTLLELVNGLTVASALTAERRSQGVFAQFAAAVSGRERKAELMTLQGLIEGQQAVAGWLSEVSAKGAVTDLALARVAGRLKETSRMAADARERGLRLAEDLRAVSGMVADLAEICEERLRGLELWRAEVESRLAAERAFDISTERWRAGKAYNRLPWPYQVLLLAREVAAGGAGRWEYEHDDGEYRARLADRITADLKDRVPGRDGLTLVSLLDESWNALPAARHRQFVAELLGAGLDQELALVGRPLDTAATLTMELSALPEGTRPARPAAAALELARRRHGWLDGGATLDEFVRTAVNEQFDLSASARRRLAVGR